MIYSLHSFIFPFVWENNYTSEEFFSIFKAENEDNIWVCSDVAVRDNSLLTVSKADMDKNPITFDKYQYFNNLCRDLIFSDTDSSLVHTLELKEKYLKELKYIITGGGKSYALDIRGISLKVFGTGIAVISINCTNSSYCDTASVKAINEYGRRLALPYWNSIKGKNPKCADKLEIKGKDLNSADDFKSFHNVQVSLSYISTVIRELLSKNGSNIRFRAKTTYNPNEIRIKPIWDEKMYVACMIIDKEFMRGLYEDYSVSDGVFCEENQRELVELINVDPCGNCSVLDGTERGRMISESVYLPQFGGDKPKLLAVTEHSYIKLLSEEDFDIGYFFDIYCQIIITALMQRMTIAVFKENILGIMRSADNSRKKLTAKDIDHIMYIQERYVAFCNSCLFSEITQKSEGRFVFSQLRKELDTDAENEMLESQLNKLYELVNTSQGHSFNKWGLVISLIAIEFNVITFFQTGKSLFETAIDMLNSIWVIVAAAAVAAAIIFWVHRLFKRKK